MRIFYRSLPLWNLSIILLAPSKLNADTVMQPLTLIIETPSDSPRSRRRATAAYSRRPPSPPYITIPLTPRFEGSLESYTIKPSDKNINAIQLTKDQYAVVTGGEPQPATDWVAGWSYEMRRTAQPVLDYLYLGPTSMVRDHSFHQKNNISMVAVVRDARMSGTPLLTVEKAAAACGFEQYYIDIENIYHLIKSLPEIIYNLNMHMIKMNDQSPPRRGHILVTCDTGNDRSAAVVAAYVMAVFGAGMHKTLQFMNIQRFCTTFDEEIKRMLWTWEDILRASADVAANRVTLQAAAWTQKPKRGVDDMMDVEMDTGDGRVPVESDTERFVGRDTFVPFADSE